jgi:hypothetical protein
MIRLSTNTRYNAHEPKPTLRDVWRGRADEISGCFTGEGPGTLNSAAAIAGRAFPTRQGRSAGSSTRIGDIIAIGEPAVDHAVEGVVCVSEELVVRQVVVRACVNGPGGG